MTKDEEDIKRVAQEIERYLVSHPAAADSLEGVAKWWLTRQRYQDALVIVEKALDYLIASGRVVKTKKSDGTCIYRKQKTK